MPQHKGFQTHLRGLEVTEGIFPRAAQVADGFIFSTGDIDGGEVPGAHAPGQLHGIAAVGFAPDPQAFSESGRGPRPNSRTLFAQIAIEPVAPGSCFIDKDEALAFDWQLAGALIDVGVSCTDGPLGETTSAPCLERHRRQQWSLCGHPDRRRVCETGAWLTSERVYQVAT